MWRTWPGFPFPEALGESAQRKDKVLSVLGTERNGGQGKAHQDW